MITKLRPGMLSLERKLTLKKKICIMFVAAICDFALLAGTAFGLDAKPIDSCIGVDHPPFERKYQGDGKSYLNTGLTLPLQHYEEKTVTGVLVGANGETAEAMDKVDANGRVFLSFPLYSYGSYTVTVIDEEGNPIFEKPVSVGPQEQPCSRESLAKSPPPEQVPGKGQENQMEPEVKEGPALESEPVLNTETSDESDRPWWPFVAVGLGLGLLAAGLILSRKGPCEKERLAWEAAERRAKDANAAAKKARAMADQAAADRAGLEAELAEIRQTHPSAGKPGGDESWIESDGKRITTRDTTMRREAEQAAWEKYRQNPNPETAAELEKAWNEAAEPISSDERRDIDEQARRLEEELEKAREAERDAQRAVNDAEKAADQADDAADKAQQIYEECIGANSVHSEDGGGSKTSSTTNSGEGTQTRECRCREDEPPQERNKRELGVVTFPVRLEVELSGGFAQAAANEARQISEQLADISEQLGWLSTAMDIKSIGSALVRDRSGWKALGESVAPVTGKALGTPLPTSPGQAAVDYLSTVAKIASVIVGKVPELQARRLPDCDLTITVVRRALRATCSETWVCRDGRWVMDGTTFTLSFVREGKTGGKRFTALTWNQAQAEIERFETIQINQLQNALDQIARMEARCGS